MNLGLLPGWRIRSLVHGRAFSMDKSVIWVLAHDENNGPLGQIGGVRI